MAEYLTKESKTQQVLKQMLEEDFGYSTSKANNISYECMKIIKNGGKRKTGVLENFGYVISTIYNKIKKPVLVLSILVVVFFGIKWLTYDHPQWWVHGPDISTRDENWRPVARDFDNSSWGTLNNSKDGQCLVEMQKSCLHNNLVKTVSDALDSAVKDNVTGEVWKGNDGNGEIWTITRDKNFRFVITRIKDPDYVEITH